MKSAYGRERPQGERDLQRVDAGTPMGELLRRYWQPIALSAEVQDLPKRVRILCEDLVVFRDQTGRVGMLDLHCGHRGTSLEFGRVEPQGIRCCYHGWLYNTAGKCIDMPCEQPGMPERMDVWQPAYPCQEFGGLVFAYMGPLEKQPLLPMYDVIDARGRADVALRGMRLWDDHSIGYVRDCNWLQHYENVVDPHHLLQLHAAISGDQFGSVVTSVKAASKPDIGFEKTPLGVRYRMFRELPNGNRLERYVENVLPNAYLVASIHEQGDKPKLKAKATELSWCVPIDNEHLMGISIVAWPAANGEPVAGWKPGTDTVTTIRPGNLRQRSYAEKQRRPDDMEAQESQGAIANHAAEHLALSDGGVVMLRRMLRESLKAIEAGRDPQNIMRDPAANRAIETHAWNTVIGPSAQAAE